MPSIEHSTGTIAVSHLDVGIVVNVPLRSDNVILVGRHRHPCSANKALLSRFGSLATTQRNRGKAQLQRKRERDISILPCKAKTTEKLGRIPFDFVKVTHLSPRRPEETPLLLLSASVELDHKQENQK